MPLDNRLSTLLHWALRLVTGLAALGFALMAIFALVAWLAPATLAGATLRGTNGHVIDIAAPGVAPVLLIVAVVVGAVILWALTCLSRLLASVRHGAPFSAANVARLRAIAWALIALSVANTIFVIAVPQPLRVALGMTDGTIDLGGLFAALVVLVLAEVFREGVRLRDDVEGTI